MNYWITYAKVSINKWINQWFIYQGAHVIYLFLVILATQLFFSYLPHSLTAHKHHSQRKLFSLLFSITCTVLCCYCCLFVWLFSDTNYTASSTTAKKLHFKKKKIGRLEDASIHKQINSVSCLMWLTNRYEYYN